MKGTGDRGLTNISNRRHTPLTNSIENPVLGGKAHIASKRDIESGASSDRESDALPTGQRMRVLFGTVSQQMPGGVLATEQPFEDACARFPDVNVDDFSFGSREPSEGSLRRVLRTLADLGRFWRILAAGKTDIVHLNSAFDRRALLRDIGYTVVARMFRIPLFLKLHGSDAELLANGSVFWKWLTVSTVGAASGVGVLSSEEKANFVAAGFSADRLFVVKNSVEWRRFDRARRVEPDLPTLLFIARFIPSKGLLTLIHAVNILRQSNRQVRLLCVGDGPQREAAEKLVRDLDLEEVIEFTGHVAEKDTVPYYLNSTVLAFPTAQEGFSMTIFQSLAAGLPIITTRIRAAADYLRAPDNCLWVDPENPPQLAEKIAYLLDHPEVAETMTRNNQVTAREFDAEIVAGEYIDIYRCILERGVGGSS